MGLQIGTVPMIARLGQLACMLTSFPKTEKTTFGVAATLLKDHTPPESCVEYENSPLKSTKKGVVSLRRRDAFEDLRRIFRFLVIQVRCGKGNDTISDKRGVRNTRLTRHNKCDCIE